MAEKNEEMLSASKWAEKLGVSAGKVKKAIEQLGLEPSASKGNCKYYSAESAEKIKDALI